MEYWTIPLTIAIGTLGIFYLFRNFNFFKRYGVTHAPPFPIFGNIASFVFRQVSFYDYIMNLYNMFPDAKYFGFYVMMTPTILLRDPEIIKSVLIKDFDTFSDRHAVDDVHDTLIAKNLFFLKEEKWRNIRTLVSSSFTSSKMKTMFTFITECAVDFTEFLSTIPADKGDIDMKDAFTKYTNDVAATCIFGLKMNTMKDSTNKFFAYSKEVMETMSSRIIKFLFFRTFPLIGKFFHVSFIAKHLSNFLEEIIKKTIDMRDTKNIRRPDILQSMMDIKDREGRRKLDIDDITAQAFVFLFSTFETNSYVMAVVTREIAANLDIQKRLQQEIDQVLKNSDGEVTYEIINRLEYLSAVINESLRLYPPLSVLERKCNKTYELPPTLSGRKPFIMKKGMTIWIPTYPIHHDEKYYDQPEKFYPERFLNNAYRNSPYYLPFGTGRRMCIANRFALLVIKVLLFHLLAQYELKPCTKMLPIKFKKTGLSVTPETEFWLNVQCRSDI